jgi:hypothetical protein
MQLSAQLARQRDPMAVIDALNRARPFWHGDVPQAQCERNRALLAACCSGRFDSCTPT